MRCTLRELSRLYAGERETNPGAVATIRLVAVNNDKKLRFVAYMTIGDGEYEVAADNGKIKVFGNVDDFLKVAAKAAESGDGVYSVEIDTGAILASTVPSNMKTWAEAQVARLNKAKDGQAKVIAAVDLQLSMMGGWEFGNAAQRAKKTELTEQRAAVVADVAAVDAEIARLNGLISGAA